MPSSTETPPNNVVTSVAFPNRFQPGCSGNPLGPLAGKKDEGELDEDEGVALQDVYRGQAKRVADRLYRLIFSTKTPPSVRLSAIKEWNDRAVGKAAQAVSVTSNTVESTVLDTAELSDAALAEIIARAKANTRAGR